MNWGKKKTKTQEPFEDCAKALVRQDPRTQVKTTTAQTETTNTSTQNSTIFNNNKNTVTYQSTKQTTTLRQTARITEITSRRTPTPEELEEMMRYLHLNKKGETTTTTTSGGVTLRRHRPSNLPAITSGVQRNSRNSGGISSKSNAKFKSNASPISRLVFSYESSSSATANDGSLTPKTPTLVKTQTTTLSEKSGRKFTQRVEERSIKFDPKTFQLSTPNSPLTRNYTGADSYQFAKPNLPALPAPPAATTTTRTTTSTTKPMISARTYISPYRQREQQQQQKRLATNTATPTITTTTTIFSTTKPPVTTNGKTSNVRAASAWKPSKSLNNSTTDPTNISTTWAAASLRSKPPPITSTSNSISSTSTWTPATPRSRPPPLTSGTSNSAGSTTTWVPASLRNKPPPLSTSTINSVGSTKLPTTPDLKVISPNYLTKSTPTIVASGKTLTTAIAKPGQAYIFNNVIFDNPNTEERIGSSEDVKSLVRTFEYFKMKVNVIENAKVDKIKKTVDKIKTKDFSNNACLVIVIMSHGTRHEEIAAKDAHYSIDDDVLFPILSNRSLIDKPKLLFIQACKGSMESQTLYRDAVPFGASANEVLKCYSTFEGFVSYRTEKGSLFIQALCENLKEFGAVKNVKDIMELVTQIVKKESKDKQIPAYTSTLTKQFIFGDYVKWSK